MIRFNPFGGKAGGPGYTSPFEDWAAAEAFAEHCRLRESHSARVCTHSSMVMTSDNSPIVVNCRAEDVATYHDELNPTNKDKWQ
jgi:hypothetical protein